MISAYLNHRAFEKVEQSSFDNTIKELVEIIEIFRNQKIPLYFYKEFFQITLSFIGLDFVNYINSNDANRDLWTYIPYIQNNLNFPEKHHKYIYYTDCEEYKKWFLEICKEEQQKNIITLTTDNIFCEDEYDLQTIKVKNIKTVTNISDWVNKMTIPDKFNSHSEVLEYLEKKYSNQLVILENAKKTTRNISSNPKLSFKILNALEGAIKILLPCLNNELSTTIQSNYKNETGFDVSGESKATMNIKDFKEQRTFTIDSEKFIFENHIKIGRKECRIHYYIKDR